MKTLIILFLALQSCTSPTKNTTVLPAAIRDTIVKHDTVTIVKRDTIRIVAPCKTDSIRKVNDQLTTRLFIANYKIERVKYYLKIAIRNPSQTKFLKSWISRAVQ